MDTPECGTRRGWESLPPPYKSFVVVKDGGLQQSGNIDKSSDTEIFSGNSPLSLRGCDYGAVFNRELTSLIQRIFFDPQDEGHRSGPSDVGQASRGNGGPVGGPSTRLYPGSGGGCSMSDRVPIATGGSGYRHRFPRPSWNDFTCLGRSPPSN